MPDFGITRSITTTQNALSVAAEVILPGKGRKFAEVKNTDAAISVYLGASSAVTTANGHLLKAGEVFTFEDYEGEVWAIAASGTPTITTIEW